MSTKACNSSLIRLLATRNYSAVAKPAASFASEVHVSTLPNKLVVASSDCVIPGISKVAVSFKAGSRYENGDNFGVSHVLRCSAGLTTSSATQFGIIRNLQAMGATLSATSDRETIIYTLQTITSNLENSLKYLKSVSVDQVFKPWELSDNVPRIKYELASLPPQAIVIDLLHSAAYRKALGNSMFVKDHSIKDIGSETLQHFVEETFKGSRGSVSGVGVAHDLLADFGSSLHLDPGSGGNSGPSKFQGGEVRQDMKLPKVYTIIAAEAASLQKKEVFVWGVLAHALGGSPSTRWGCGVSPLSKALSGIPSASAAVVAMPHSDSGLLGVHVSCDPQHCRQAVEAVMKVMEGTLSEADVARGKAKLVAELLLAAESSDSLLSEMAYQSLLVGSVSTPQALAQAASAVSAAQVQDALKKFVSGKKAMAALGNLHDTPYLDEL